MEFNEINVHEGIIQQIDPEGQFVDVAVDMGNRDHIYSNVNLDMSYEDFDELNIERARYLLSTDEMFEEMLNKTQE